jgi:hypothetical protein
MLYFPLATRSQPGTRTNSAHCNRDSTKMGLTVLAGYAPLASDSIAGLVPLARFAPRAASLHSALFKTWTPSLDSGDSRPPVFGASWPDVGRLDEIRVDSGLSGLGSVLVGSPARRGAPAERPRRPIRGERHGLGKQDRSVARLSKCSTM